MIATPQAITEAKGKRRPRLRLMLNSVAERRLGARGMASLGRKLAAAGFGLVHACGGCGIEIARGAHAAGGDLLLVVPYHLKDCEPLTWVVGELVVVDGDAAAECTASSLADATVIVGERDPSDCACLVPSPKPLAANAGEIAPARQSNPFAQSAAELVQGLLNQSDQYASLRDASNARIQKQQPQSAGAPPCAISIIPD
jgi:hypothetical protein